MGLQPDIIVAYTHNISDGGIRVHKLPRAGETVRALEGGLGIDGAKGTNVAVAASRAGAKVALVAHVQGGAWFDRAEKLLREEEIDDRFVFCHPGTRQVPGCIIIDDEGNNMIILGSGTQQALLHEEVDLALESMQSARYCVTGYELDVKSVEYLVRKARMLGIQTILNPSPVPNQKPGFWDLSLIHISEPTRLTLGPKGFCCLDGNNKITFGKGAKVDSIDATGAGDGFLGAMTARLAAGDSLGEACRWANQYAAYTVQKSGTISSYPRLSELKLQR